MTNSNAREKSLEEQYDEVYEMLQNAIRENIISPSKSSMQDLEHALTMVHALGSRYHEVYEIDELSRAVDEAENIVKRKGEILLNEASKDSSAEEIQLEKSEAEDDEVPVQPTDEDSKVTQFPKTADVEEELSAIEQAVNAYCRENGHGSSVRKMMLRIVTEEDIRGSEESVNDNLDEKCLQAIDHLKQARARKEKLAKAKEELENSERDAILKQISELDDPVSAFTNKIVQVLDMHCVFWEDVLMRVREGDYDGNIYKQPSTWVLYCAHVWEKETSNFEPWLVNVIASIVAAWESPRVKKTIGILEKEAAKYGYTTEQIKQGTEVPDLQGKDPYSYKYFQSAVRAANNWDLNPAPVTLKGLIENDFLNDMCNNLEDRVDEEAISRVEVTRAAMEASHQQQKANPTWSDQHKVMSTVLKAANAPSTFAYNASQAKKHLYCESTGLTEEEYEARAEERKARREEKKAQRQQAAQNQTSYGYGTARSSYGNTRSPFGNTRGSFNNKSNTILIHLIAAAVSVVLVLILFIAMDNVFKRTLLTAGIVACNVGGICLSVGVDRKTSMLILGAGALLVLVPAFLM